MPQTPTSLSGLQAEYQEKIAGALDNAKTKLKTEMELAALTFESIVKAGEAGIWQSPTLAPILKSLGLKPAAGTEVGNGQTGRKRPTARVKGRARKSSATVKAMGREMGNGKSAFVKSRKWVSRSSKKK